MASFDCAIQVLPRSLYSRTLSARMCAERLRMEVGQGRVVVWGGTFGVAKVGVHCAVLVPAVRLQQRRRAQPRSRPAHMPHAPGCTNQQTFNAGAVYLTDLIQSRTLSRSRDMLQVALACTCPRHQRRFGWDQRSGGAHTKPASLGQMHGTIWATTKVRGDTAGIL